MGSYTLNTKLYETPWTQLLRGYRNDDGAPVVVKSLRPEHPNPIDLTRLRHEYALLKSLNLPGVARPLELRPAGHGLELVLEDAGETSLHSLIHSGRLNLRRSLELAISVTAVVAAVHRQGVVHKDLKPHHFLLRAEIPDSLVLVDFALATRLSRHAQVAATATQIEGSLPYIAPEQTGRMNRVVDHRSDLYSLGVVLYELFTKCLPFQSSDPMELVHSHIARRPRPPTEVAPSIPEVLSSIILKLLSKAAEDRYQSASGLLVDLERCLHGLSGTGRVRPFPLAERDTPTELTIPQRMYGRQIELQAAVASYERSRHGATELLLLSGESGIGKSTLAAELKPHLAAASYFAAGKFDHLHRGIPYGPLVRIFRELVRSLLVEPSAVLSRRAQSLRKALGPNGRLVVDLVPDLETVIGSQPDVPTLGPAESQSRLELVLQRFVLAFASAEHPLVLFLDDLQWADPASLRLIQVVLTAPSREHLLVVGAFRSNEVDASHPLTLALERLRAEQVAVTELELAPLAAEHVAELIADTFRSSVTEIAPLAEVLLGKTQGNPFLLLQMLVSLNRDGLIRFDEVRGTWEWDLEPIRGALATDSVVEFMLGRLRRLSPATQAVLRVAACIGHRFDDATVAVVSSQSVDELRSHLWEALQMGLIVPLDDAYRYTTEDLPEEGQASTPTAHYRFLHDRVQQAAAALMDDADQARLHHEIGRLLLDRCEGSPRDDDLFTVVDHLNQALEWIADEEEREQLARLNLAAGEKARDAAAANAGVHYLATAQQLLGDAPWGSAYDSAFRSHLLRAECEYLAGNLEEALRLVDAIEQHAASTLDRCQGRHLRMVLLVKTGQMATACSLTVETAALLGMPLPSPEDQTAMQAATGAEFAAFQAALAGRSIESLATLPLASEPEPLALMRTIVGGFPAAFQSNPTQFALLVLKAATLTLSHGRAPSAPLVFAQYGLVHQIATGDAATAYRFGEVGIELCDRPEHATAAGPTHFIVGGFLAHWREDLTVALHHLSEGLRLSLEAGDLEYAAYCAASSLYSRVYRGDHLAEVKQTIPDMVEFARRTGDVVNIGGCLVLQQLIAALEGRTEARGSLFDTDFDRARLQSLPYPVQTFAATAMTTAWYLGGRYREALEAADAHAPLPGNGFHGDHSLYGALALLQLARDALPEEREAYLGRARAISEALQRWAQAAPRNHGPRHALVRAELAAVEGRTNEAMELYERAIALAHEHKLTPQEALANELCGAFHIDHGRPKAARGYLMEAHYCYHRWGARDKLHQLASRHPQWFDTGGTQLLRVPDPNVTLTAHDGKVLDVATVVRASQAIVGELIMARLVERLMQVLLEEAGAERGFLLLLRDGSPRIVAAISTDPDSVEVGLDDEPGEHSELAVTVVRYVVRVGEILAIPDASREHRFGADPYVARRHPKSILCVPMTHRGSLLGVLYLENNLATEAFTPARTELLQLLAAQAAAAVENARLYTKLASTTEELRVAKETLESQVAARTEELQQVLRELWSEMDLARKLQTLLLPTDPRLPDYEVAAEMIPAAEVGGDYYDVVTSGSASWLLVGDVSGHGVAAGLVMVMVQSAVRAVLQATDSVSPAALLDRLNASLWNSFKQIGGEQYMTITALKLDDDRVTHAGLHQDILVYRVATGSVEQIETHGAWVGLLPDLAPALADRHFRMNPGDTMLLYTDGLPERFMVGGQRLGIEGLASLFRSAVERFTEPSAVIQSLVGVLAGKPLEDDVTVMAVRYAPREPG